MIRILRLFWVGWVINMKSLTRSGFFIFTSVVEPLIMAAIAYYLFKVGKTPGTLLYASLGAALMGVWTSTLFGSGGAIQWQRWQGTLEPTVVAPPRLILVLFPLTASTASIGIYSLVATLLWGRFVFGIPLDLARPVLFFVTVFVAILVLGILGLVIASSFMLYRNANALANMLEFPVWLVTGVIVPLSLLPGWVHPIGWVLAPTWGYEAIRGAAFGGEVLTPLAVCIGLGIVYVPIAQFFINVFEVRARERATLSLV